MTGALIEQDQINTYPLGALYWLISHVRHLAEVAEDKFDTMTGPGAAPIGKP